MKLTKRTIRYTGRFGVLMLLAMLFFAMPARAKAESATPSQPSQEGAAQNGLVAIGSRYVLYVNGAQVTKPGWKELPKEKFKINDSGYVTARMKEVGGFWKYYTYSPSAPSWQLERKTWKKVNNMDYYFNASGKCIKTYNLNTKKCRKYTNGEMKTIKKGICELRNGKLYYFNSKGVRVTKKSWQAVSSTLQIEIGKKGYVTCKMQSKNGYWSFYKYNYSTGKWLKERSIWKIVGNKKYYFNKSGKCTLYYNMSTQKCYDCIGGKMTLVRSDIREVSGSKYYFGSNGVKVNSAGLYLTSSKLLIYVSSNGKVEKEISGELLEYTSSGSRITSCRVKDSNYMRYYNGEGTLTREIDLYKPIVALTYDDGPSIYTPAILDILQQYGGAATFFVVGNRVSAYPDALRRAYSMGCEIGNHTYSHKILTKLSVPEIQSQITATNDVVRSVTGASPTVMRPPGGGYNSTVTSAVGMPLILWSIDTLDWKTKNAALTQAAVLNHIQNGDIVLMHDLYRQTADASAAIIPALVSRGYQLVTIKELSDCRGAMAPGGVYRHFR
ncbi:MAG: polysaccharide deacetylase family protein [Lachnospiraceae bacterium]|jgi:peptidoglycan/xylan/chitin deacetylase (PgdA/CDA1 family)|nr:polysaccharide deacetylase family protein [Lachnospiraceae bacterium]